MSDALEKILRRRLNRALRNGQNAYAKAVDDYRQRLKSIKEGIETLENVLKKGAKFSKKQQKNGTNGTDL